MVFSLPTKVSSGRWEGATCLTFRKYFSQILNALFQGNVNQPSAGTGTFLVVFGFFRELGVAE